MPARSRSTWLRPWRLAIERPRSVLAGMVALPLLAAPGLLRLELSTDGHTLVPSDDPAVLRDAEIRGHFDLADPVVVYLETGHPAGIYNPETLRRVREITDRLAELEGIERRQLTSLATEGRDRVDSFDYSPFLEPLPATPEEIAALRADVDAAAILRGTLVALDERGSSILVSVPPGGDRVELYQRIAAAVGPFETAADRIEVVGAPVAEALLGLHVLRDLRLLLPLSLAVIGGVLGLAFRRPWAVLLGLFEVGACQLFVFGLLGWSGEPVYLTTAVLPVILTTVGLTDEIHLLWHYQRQLAAGNAGSKLGAVSSTLGEIARPITLTSATTAIGFLSFLGSEIEPVRSFGVFAALGVLFCLAWSLLAIPACLALLPAERLRRPEPASAGARTAGAGAPSRASLVRWLRPLLGRRPVLAVLAVATLAVGFGVTRVQVQDGWVRSFARDSPFRRSTERVDRALHGTHLLLVHLAFAPPAAAGAESERVPPLHRIENLRAIAELESFIRERPGVGGVLGTHGHLSAVTFLARGRPPGPRTIPEDPAGIRRMWKRFDQGRGEARRREVADDEMRRTVVTVFLEEANYRQTAELMAAIRAHARERLEPLGASLDFAGDVAVSQAMIPAIVRSQITSLALALAGILAALLLIFRALGTALLGLLPATLAVIWTLGLMGWLDVPLGVATSTFCAISLGIGVDFPVHFLDRIRRGRAAGLPSPTAEAVGAVGPAILADSLALALGFGLLTLSGVPANANLGWMVAATVATACVMTLLGLGSLLARGEGGASFNPDRRS